jgi:hypothetical protein
MISARNSSSPRMRRTFALLYNGSPAAGALAGSSGALSVEMEVNSSLCPANELLQITPNSLCTLDK